MRVIGRHEMVDTCTLPSGQDVALTRVRGGCQDGTDGWQISMDITGDTVVGKDGMLIPTTAHGIVWCDRYEALAREAWELVRHMDEVGDHTMHGWWMDNICPLINGR